MVGMLKKILGVGRFAHLNYRQEILIVNLILSGPIYHVISTFTVRVIVQNREYFGSSLELYNGWYQIHFLLLILI
jgi:hypothetical protein